MLGMLSAMSDEVYQQFQKAETLIQLNGTQTASQMSKLEIVPPTSDDTVGRSSRRVCVVEDQE